MESLEVERIDKQYGPWVVLEKLKRVKVSGKWTGLYRCACIECDSEKEILGKRFYYPPVCGCGCNKKRRQLIHGMSRTAIYKIWSSMKSRCLTKTNHHYHRYGGAGVTFCDEWLRFEVFYSDMGDRPTPIHTIDRKDGSKGYSKENCRWATPKEQANNTKTNRKITAFGKTMNLGEWAKQVGMSKNMLKYRLDIGVPPENALSLPSVRGTKVLQKVIQREKGND